MSEQKLTHVNEQGSAHMVDVSAKDITARTAAATGYLKTTADITALLKDNALAKGDALATARIAGIMGAKRTADLIPLCHPLPISEVELDIEIDAPEPGSVQLRSRVKTTGKTGVEMEALTAVSVAALTLYDMIKAVDHHAVITDIAVLGKTGGASGDWGEV